MKRVILRVMMLVAMASAAVTMSVHTSSKEVKASEKGDAVVKYAKNFVGNRYRYGGSSLTKGTDCSGFTRGVYKKFGKRLPHSSSAQRRYGKKVKGGIKNAKAGDLICYSGHVAIYMGNNKIVHASNSAPYPRGGIKISNNARYRRIVTVRRIVIKRIRRRYFLEKEIPSSFDVENKVLKTSQDNQQNLKKCIIKI